MNKYGKNKIARNKWFKNKNCNMQCLHSARKKVFFLCKISIITDVNGIPLSVLINKGTVHDLSFINGHIIAPQSHYRSAHCIRIYC